MRADKYVHSPPEVREIQKEGYKEFEYIPDYGFELDPVKENRLSYFRLFEPKNQPVKGDLVLLHGIGDGNIPYVQAFARLFAQQGIRTAFQILPYHYKQTPEGVSGGQLYYSANPDICVKRFHMAVRDTRKILDYLETCPSHLESKTYVMGLSFGGIIATMAMAIDKRIKAGTLMITGGNWRWINFHSPYSEPIRIEVSEKSNPYGCRSEADCKKRFRTDPVGWVKENVNDIDDIFEKAPIPCYHYDPLSYAPLVDQPVLFVKARFDRIMPKPATEELQSLLPNKTVKTIPTGHKSSILFTRRIVKWSVSFFEENAPDQKSQGQVP